MSSPPRVGAADHCAPPTEAPDRPLPLRDRAGRSATRHSGDAAWALLLALALLPWWLPGLRETLVFDRASIAAGQWWRLATGHWVHFSAAHLIPDLAACLLLGLALPRAGGGSPLRFTGFAAPAIGLLLYVGEPAMARYGGLSGIAFGLAGALALQWASAPAGALRTPLPGTRPDGAAAVPAPSDANRADPRAPPRPPGAHLRWPAALALAILATVVLAQYWRGPRPGSGDFLASPDAHLAGLIAALVWHGLRRPRRRVLQ